MGNNKNKNKNKNNQGVVEENTGGDVEATGTVITEENTGGEATDTDTTLEENTGGDADATVEKETPIEHAFNAVLEAKSLDDQVVAKRQIVIVLTNEVEKDATAFRGFFNLVKDTESALFGLEYGAIDEITYGVDAETKAWNALVVIVNLIIEGGNLPFDNHGVQSQFTGNYTQLGSMLAKAMTK